MISSAFGVCAGGKIKPVENMSDLVVSEVTEKHQKEHTFSLTGPRDPGFKSRHTDHYKRRDPTRLLFCLKRHRYARLLLSSVLKPIEYNHGTIISGRRSALFGGTVPSDLLKRGERRQL